MRPLAGHDPGPRPEEVGRTVEQRMALAAGGVFLLAALVTAIDVVWRIDDGGPTLLVLPVFYLALGWVAMVAGLQKLSAHQFARSEARGPWLAVGLLILLLCAPLPASLAYPVHTTESTVTCECGARVQAKETRNYWGTSLTRSHKVVKVTPPAQPNAPDYRTCDHAQHLHWDDE